MTVAGRTLRALVVAGDGINCEQETAQALELAGFKPVIHHLNDLIAGKFGQGKLCSNYAALALPGGFSFGDDIFSGKVLSLKLKYGLKWDLHDYAEKGGLVIGVCNGFQALIRMGIFGKEISITHNADGKFHDQWIKAVPSGTRCVWLKGLGTVDLPIRNGEGRIACPFASKSSVVGKLERQGMACLRYEVNPLGSDEDLAGLCDATGRIFGLMPHPEAFVRWSAHPEWTLQPARAGSPGHGLAMFENAFKAAKDAT